jgi:hypothetical protein
MSDDVQEAVANADLDEAADQAEDIDEGRSGWDKAPFWGYLLLMLLLPFGLLVYLLHTGRLDFLIEVVATIDLSGPLNEAATWGVRIILFVGFISALVIAPGDYLAMILRALDGFSYDEDDE